MTRKAEAGLGFLTAFIMTFMIAGVYLTLNSDITEDLQATYYTDIYSDVLTNNETASNTGLVTFFKMDETVEETAILNEVSVALWEDECSGVVSRTTDLLTGPGVIGTSLVFDEAELDFGFALCDNMANYSYKDEFTISLYLNWTGEMQESIIAGDLEMWLEDYPGWVFKVLEDGKLAFIWLTETSSTEGQNLTTTSAITNNSWYHIAYVNYLNGTDYNAKIYINGTADATRANWTLVNSSYNEMGISIGYAGDEADVYFNGYIDEFKVFDTNISAAKVAVLADALTNESWIEPDIFYDLTYENQLTSTVYSNEAAYNVTAEMQAANSSLAERLPLIALVVGIIVTLGFLVMVKL